MPTSREDMLKEANRRGLLQGPQKDAFDEAVKRGLIQDSSSSSFVGPTIDQVTETSPIPLRNEAVRSSEADPSILLDAKGGLGRTYTDKERANALQGINIYKGLPEALRWQLPFLDELDKINKIEQSGRPVRRPNGEIQWWDADTRRWTQIDSANTEVADFTADPMGSALPVTMSALFTAAATAALPETGGLSSLGAVTSGAVGTGIGEYLNQIIGQHLDLTPGVDYKEGLEPAGKAALIDEAFGVGGMAVTGLKGVYRKIFYPGGIAEKAPGIYNKFTPDKVDLVDSITALAKKPFLSTVGEMTGDQFLLQLQQAAAKHNDLAEGFAIRYGDNRSALESAFHNLNDFRVTHADEYERANAIRQSLKDDLDKQLDAAQTADAAVRRKVSEDVVSIVPEGDPKLIGQKASIAAWKEHAPLVEQVDAAYDKVRELTRYDPETGRSAILPLRPDKELAEYWATLNRSSKETTLGSLEPYSKLKKGKIEEILSGRLKTQKLGKDSDEYLNFTIPTMPDGTPIGNVAGTYQGPRVNRPGPFDSSMLRTPVPGNTEEVMAGVDINQLNEDIKLLRYAQDSKEGTPAHVLEEHITQLEQFRARALKDKPDVLQAIEYAEGLRTRQAKEFDDTVISSMFAVDRDNKYSIADKEAFALIFEKTGPKGEAGFGQFMNIVKKDKSALQAVKDGFRTLYNAEVLNPNTLLPKSKDAHRAFMKEYEDRMGQVFSPNELDKIKSIGGFDSVVEKSAKDTERLTAKLNASTQGKLGNMNNPQALTKTLMTGGTEGLNIIDVNNTVEIANKAGLGEALKKSTADWLVEKITRSNPKNPFSVDALDDVLSNTNSNGYRSKLESIMGPQYVSNLEKIRDGLKMTLTRPEVIPKGPSDSGTMFGFLRSWIIGPLSKEGRVMSQVRAGQKSQAAQVVANLILDTSGASLRKMVQIERNAATTDAAIRFLATVGGAGIATQAVQGPSLGKRLDEALGD